METEGASEAVMYVLKLIKGILDKYQTLIDDNQKKRGDVTKEITNCMKRVDDAKNAMKKLV